MVSAWLDPAGFYRTMRIDLGDYVLDFRLGSTKAWIARPGGEAMQTDSSKLARALIAAVDEYWRKEF